MRDCHKGRSDERRCHVIKLVGQKVLPMVWANAVFWACPQGLGECSVSELFTLELMQKFLTIHHLRNAGHIGQSRLVLSVGECGTTVPQHNRVVVSHMGISHAAGHPPIGHNPSHDQGVDSRTAQHPIELGIEKRRIGNFLNAHIHLVLECVHHRLPPRARGKIAFSQKTSLGEQMR